MACFGRGVSVLFAVLCLSAGHAAGQDPSLDEPKYICGTWRVQGVVATTPYAAAADVVKPYFGVEARYSAGEMRFGSGVTIAHPAYQYTDISASDFETAFLVSFANLRVKGSVGHLVDVRDPPGVKRGPDRIGTTVVVRNENQILVPWAGHFLDLARTGPPCGG